MDSIIHIQNIKIIKQWYEWVETFHDKFEHPISGPKGMPLSEPRRIVRTNWLQEELLEMLGAERITAQVDSLLDLLYFAFGNFVEMGRCPTELCSSIDIKPTAYINPLSFQARIEHIQRMSASVLLFTGARTIAGQKENTLDVCRRALFCLKGMGINPQGLMDIVQDSNMGKLWPDGMAKYNNLGKVIKPPTWESPNERLREEIHRRINTQEEEIEIPF